MLPVLLSFVLPVCVCALHYQCITFLDCLLPVCVCLTCLPHLGLAYQFAYRPNRNLPKIAVFTFGSLLPTSKDSGGGGGGGKVS